MNKEVVFSREFFNTILGLIDVLIEKLVNLNENQVYPALRKLIIYFFNKTIDITELSEDLVKKFIRYNITSESRDRIFYFVREIEKIDYGKVDIDKKLLISILESFRRIVEDVYVLINNKEDEKRLNKFSVVKNKSVFLFNLNKIKKSSVYDIDLIALISSHYSKLSKKDKEFYHKDFTYYVIRHPELLQIMAKLKHPVSLDERHELIVRLNKLYFKLGSEHKKYLNNLLQGIITGPEEKINISLMFAYNFLHENNLDDLKKSINQISSLSNDLDNEKKKYYCSIIKRLEDKYEKYIC